MQSSGPLQARNNQDSTGGVLCPFIKTGGSGEELQIRMVPDVSDAPVTAPEWKSGLQPRQRHPRQNEFQINTKHLGKTPALVSDKTELPRCD
jgi:hypothetical protein